MSPTDRSRYTLIIPTYNRPVYLRSLLGYLKAQGFEYPVCILDSSFAEAISANRQSVDQAGLDVAYHTFDPTTPVTKKIALGFELIDTPYCSMCADDDVLLTKRLGHLLDFLDVNPFFVSIHGYYVNFHPGADYYAISDTVYYGSSIAESDALKRIIAQMSDYQAIFYAIHRTSVMRSALQQALRLQTLFGQELLLSSLILIAGGVRRASDFYMARNMNPSIADSGWSPHHFLATDPESLLREYEAYRAIVLEQLANIYGCSAPYEPDQIRRAFDVVHLKYFAPMLSPEVLDYIVAETLTKRAPQEIIAGIWRHFVTVPERKVSFKRFLYDLFRALLRSGSRRDVFNRVSRLVRLRNRLTGEHRLHASIGPRLDDVHVDRTVRDGSQRRYRIPDRFVSQKLGDGSAVTVPQIADMIVQLDNYV
jgi:glycosyltransferase domain-containing protein